MGYQTHFISAFITAILISSPAFAASAADPNFKLAGEWASPAMYSFPDREFEGRTGPRTNSLLIWHDGELVFENYARGYTAEKPHAVWSISKSLTTLLFAAAEQMGKAHRDDSICKYAENIPKEHCDISFKNLIQWTSGLEWLEEYENSERVEHSSVLNMLYAKGYSNMQKFVLRHKQIAKPGELWRYSSGDSHLLASLLPAVFGLKDQPLQAYSQFLLNPADIQSDWAIELDGAGRPIGASNMYFTPRSILNIGKLLISGGVSANKQRVLPEDWIDFMFSVPEAFKTNRKDHEEDVNISGSGFWLNKAEGTGMDEPWPAAPKDTIVAMGHWGQYLIVVPSMKLIVVRTGDTRDKSFKLKEFIPLVVKAVENDKKN